MSVSVSKTLLFSSGPIKFSDLRSSFKEQSSGSVSASELRRNTNTNTAVKDLFVPDATENASVSTGSNLKLSQFRNTIKYYDLNQSGTDTNLNLFDQTWNSNLSKTIVKRVTIGGTCGSTSSTAALYFNALVYNLYLIINGSVLGAGGSAGTSTTGGNGGPAMSLISTGNAIQVTASSSAAIYGGGGGGAKGAQGATGPAPTCYYYVDSTTGENCGGCPGCSSGWYQIGCYGTGGCNCGKRGCRSTKYRSVCRTNVYYNGTPPAGGAGGNGGVGQGYSQTRTDGSAGSAGALSSCSPNLTQTQTQGETGETGGNGGDWATAGSKTSLANGGSAGAAVIGSNYTITSDSSTSAFKGSK